MEALLPGPPGFLWASEVVTRLVGHDLDLRPIVHSAWDLGNSPATVWQELVELTTPTLGPENAVVVERLVIDGNIAAEDYEAAFENPLDWVNPPLAGSGLDYPSLLAIGLSYVSDQIHSGRFSYFDPALPET